MTSPQSIVVVGANLAGGRAVEAMRKEGYDGRITLIGEEPLLPYERPPLSKEFLRGEQPLEKSFIKPEGWYTENDIDLFLEHRADRLHLKDHAVELHDGHRVQYDKLLLCTGGRPRKITIPGSELTGVLMLRTVDDSIAIQEALKPGARIAVVGAGFIGSEIAASAKMLGCEVVLLEAEPVPLKRALGEEMGRIHGEIHRENGVDLRTNMRVESFEGDSQVRRVIASGEAFEADAVVVGVGLIPNIELAEDVGIDVSNGIVVNEHCQTAVPDVYAAGDVANHPNPILGERIRVEHWQNAQNQGAAAGRAMLGAKEPFAEVPWFWSDQYGINLQMFGHPLQWDRIVFRGDVDGRNFSAFYLHEGRMVAALAVNRGKDARAARQLIGVRTNIDPAVLSDEGTDLRALAKQAAN